ncbi:MAG: hypothetical protein LLG20_15180 [Acidobacteriales bacterium]|nr:hypothetical protein [Terriglobales bacterium]
MAGGFWTGAKRFVLWDYPRACWQYDVMVGLILAFIFLTPRGWFRDQPRIPNASSITMLPAVHGASVYWVDMDLLTPVPEPQRAARIEAVLEDRTGKKQKVVRLEPVRDSEEALKGYMAFTRSQ